MCSGVRQVCSGSLAWQRFTVSVFFPSDATRGIALILVQNISVYQQISLIFLLPTYRKLKLKRCLVIPKLLLIKCGGKWRCSQVSKNRPYVPGHSLRRSEISRCQKVSYIIFQSLSLFYLSACFLLRLFFIIVSCLIPTSFENMWPNLRLLLAFFHNFVWILPLSACLSPFSVFVPLQYLFTYLFS